MNILWMLLRLRQACDHPLLVKGHNYKGPQKVNADEAMKLPAEKREHLLSLLKGNRDICPICSVSLLSCLVYGKIEEFTYN